MCNLSHGVKKSVRLIQRFIRPGPDFSGGFETPRGTNAEVVWNNVRCLDNGEAVSVDGTHLGHNLPDSKGNRYCINLVSVAGNKE